MDYRIFEVGNVVPSGATIRSFKLAYNTFGQLIERKDDAIVYATWYSGRHYDNEWLGGDGAGS